MLPTKFIKLLDYHVITSIIFLISAWKWGDWKNWRQYYPTILFFILGNFTHNLLTYNYPLWEYESPFLKKTLSDILVSFVLFPSTILLYLPHFPKKLKKQIIYVLFWVAIYTILEMVSHYLGFFSYHNGWNIGWSILFDCLMFPLLWLHHKNPLWVWPIGFIVSIALLVIFKVPLSSMK